MIHRLISLFLMMTVAGSVEADDLTAVVSNSTTGSNNGAIDLILNGGVAPYNFEWTGPNGFSSFEEDINGLAPGEYCVTVLDVFCGLALLCVVVEEDIASGIAVMPVSTLDVFPNPFSRDINVAFEVSFPGEYHFQLLDMYGKMEWEEIRTFATGKQNIRFSFSTGIASGRYELMVQHKQVGVISRSVVSIE